ncbi:PLP-dependent aminotransferase family protein [Allobranchiibius huperziae]|uniref:DNA-binding transcriptional MocR family regulator n=1 Tax=Allobranchiibius huperziae TaxID=1874116 RepID=A0A853DIW5_9MICO|nr:PLP-dependent aminotransferase family protein [Allobranchiibius huperziae]NYJ74964.1 DNA-binding transcriptional MocR family regulator [Allobranchiibius huperziae]
MQHITGRRLTTLLGAPDPGRPAYLWLADGIHGLVADGRLLHGTRLPSERELVDAVGASRTTVTRAYAVLGERGYAVARRGSGTVVQLPGGPVAGGGEPLPGWEQDEGGGDVIDLRRAAQAAPPGLREALEAATARLPAYVGGAGYFPLGVPELRESIAARYAERGVPTDASQIFVTSGALSALVTVFRAVIGRGDRVVIESPTYAHSVGALRHTGARLVPVPIGPVEIDREARDQALAAGAGAMLALPDFHNPTGLSLDDDDRARLACVWQRHGVVGIVDETLTEVWLDEAPDVLPMAAHSRGCVSVGSASKTFWGGLRIGWIRAPRELVGAIAAARATLDLGAPVLEQLITAELMRTSATLHPDARAGLIESRAALLQLRNALPQWEVRVPSGGLSLWWRMPKPRATRLAAIARQHGVLLDPGSTQAVQGSGLEHYVRTPFALADAARAAVPALVRSWEQIAQEDAGSRGGGRSR